MPTFATLQAMNTAQINTFIDIKFTATGVTAAGRAALKVIAPVVIALLTKN
jgi:hypothetical protein